jgi:leucyl aminopeptidase
MRIEVVSAAPAEVTADVLVAPIVEPPTPVSGAAADLDHRLDGRLSRVIEKGEASGKLWTAPLLHVNGQLPAERVAPAGLGPREEVDADAIRTAAAAVVRASDTFSSTIAWVVDESLPLPAEEHAVAAVEGVLLGGYDPARWKSADERPHRLERLLLCSTAPIGDAVRRAECTARWTNRARDFANEPANILTPEGLAERAAEIADGSPHLSSEAYDFDQIVELGMGAFAGVAQGSHNPARLIVMRYEPAQASGGVVLGLVGKALTFDTGGISIKNATYMEDMKGDMAGGGAVIAAMGALAELEVPLRVLAVVAATENAIGGGSFRPGDILTAMNGKTIEVINTDAEGRLVLADALVYARELGATHLLDLATLTGTMERALGDFYAGVFANEDGWRAQVVEAGEASGDHAWPWPLHPRYRRYIDSHFADLKNVNIRLQGGPVYAAELLKEFAGEGPWAHVDMAGTGFLTWPRHDYLWQKGGTGYGVRLICELARRLAAA